MADNKTGFLDKALAYVMLAGGLAGFMAASILTIEKIELIKNPAFQPSCNISPILSCGSVMSTSQAEVFGFPNSLLGIAGFAVVAILGLALLAGGQFRRWFWLCAQAGVTFGIGFVFWLQYQSIYAIGALCPYCMVVWAAMIPIFWYVTLYNLRQGHLKVAKGLQSLNAFSQRHHGDILISWYLVLAALVLQRFWAYWISLIP